MVRAVLIVKKCLIIVCFMGKEYSCTGEFYVDTDNKLHHTFVAPSGREIEIVCDYE